MFTDPVGVVWLNILFVIIIPMILYFGCYAAQHQTNGNGIDKSK